MSDFSIITGLQSELDVLSRRRKSLELDVLALERKIDALNQNLKENAHNRKMMSLKEFLETEKQRIELHQISKINVKAKQLEDKIESIRGSRVNSSSSQNFECKSRRASANEYFSRPKTSHHTTKPEERKYQSLPISRPHTSNGSETHFRESFVPLLQKTDSTSPIQSNPHSDCSMHLPMCMSMNICKDCTAVREYFEKMKESQEEMHKNSSKSISFYEKCGSECVINNSFEDSKVNSNFNIETPRPSVQSVALDSKLSQTKYCLKCRGVIGETGDQISSDEKFEEEEINSKTDEFIKLIETCTSFSECEYCSKLHAKYAEIVSPFVEKEISITGLSASQEIDSSKDNNSLNSEQLDVTNVLSASILATCESHAFCECCNNNLSKLSIPTPSSSIVALGCMSHEHCNRCNEVFLESSRKNSLESEQTSSKASSSKSMNIASKEIFTPLKQGSNGLTEADILRKRLSDEIRKEMEIEHQVIVDTKEQIRRISLLNSLDARLPLLKNMMEVESLKLEDMKKLSNIEEQKMRNESVRGKPFVVQNY